MNLRDKEWIIGGASGVVIIFVFVLYLANRLDNYDTWCETQGGTTVKTPNGWKCVDSKAIKK